ncbi:S9 family peptidase [Pseudokineococcus basanitobsidens]|uniref:S9 family peptidase n=1 Tax=Pseudokineococcus basanitobsidens TaxID=1926649 RepID=A0ABU8RFR4_9ACTN
MSSSEHPAPPVAERRPVRREHHGDVVEDPYEWLRAKEDPAVRAHLEAENAHTRAVTEHLERLRSRVFDEIRARTQETDLSVPAREGGWWYYGRTVEGQQYGLSCRAPVTDVDDWTPPTAGEDGALPGEQVLLDANVEAEGHEFFSLGAASVSPDGRRLAWSGDTTGDERYTLRVRDLETGEDLPDEVPGAFYGATWSVDSEVVHYTVVDEAWRPHEVRRHRVGTDAAQDDVLFREDDARFWVGVGRTRSRRYLVVESAAKTTTEVRVLDTTEPGGELRVVAPRREGVEYEVEHVVLPQPDGSVRDRFLVLHNDGAEDFELAVVDVDDPSPQHWEVVLPHEPGRRLEGVAPFAGFVALAYRRDVLPRLAIAPLTAQAVGAASEVEVDEELFSVGLGGNRAFDQPLVRFVRTSFVTPPRVLDLDVATGEQTLRRETPVLGGYASQDYVQRRTWATAPDGVRVPVSVVARRDVAAAHDRGERAPLVLYGYGSYEASMDPAFSTSRLSLLDRGVVFALAHVRGGGELGRHWYDDGKRLRKRNTFTDFVAAADALVEQGWTTPARTVAMGGSAGGLLMGAAMNLAPQAFAGVLAQVPFVDPLTSILDPSLPLTVTEWDEWGNPLADPEVYAYMKGYSPYENVAAVDHPAVLAMTSLHDTRVLYVEPAKWVARLREVGTGGRPVLLRTEMDGGHGGPSGRYKGWEERAFEYAWVLDVLAAPPEPLPAPA